MHCGRHPGAAAKSGTMDPAEVEIISVLIVSEKVLCLRIASESPLMGQSAHILDGCLAHLQMNRSRMEADETDVSGQLLPLLRSAGTWPEAKNASLLELEGTRAIGVGSNIKARRRSAWLAMALAFVVSAGRRGHNPHQLTRLLSEYGLNNLATTAWHVMSNRPALNAPESAQAHTQGVGSGTAPDPQPAASPEPASVAGRFRWGEERRQERSSNPGRWREGQVAQDGISPGATYTQGMSTDSEVHQPMPEPVSAQIPSHAGTVFGAAGRVVPGVHQPEASLRKDTRSRDVQVPPTPTLEDNFDFAIGLYPGLVSNFSRVLVFNDPIGVEEC